MLTPHKARPTLHRTLRLYPFIGLSAALIAGIAAADRFTHYTDQTSLPGGTLLWISGIALLCVAAVLIAAASASSRALQHPQLQRRASIGFTLMIAGIFVALGFFLTLSSLTATTHRFPEVDATYMVRLTDTPHAKSNSLSCTAELIDPNGSTRQLILYFEQPATQPTPAADNDDPPIEQADTTLTHQADASLLRPGHRLLIRTTLHSTLQDGYYSSGYRRYLLYHDIAGTGYVANGHWQYVAHDTLTAIRHRANRWRRQITSLFPRLGFGADEAAVLSALTVGEKEQLDKDLRRTYSTAGVSHVLALSGLHIGLLAYLLTLLFGPLTQRGKSGRLTASVLTAAILWGFALFTGGSASVVRATLLFSLLSVARLQRTQPVSLNLWAFAAFVQLLIRPQWLFDVGFQLSYAAVASLIVLQPRLSSLWAAPPRLLRYPWGLLTASVAAQIGVAPLVIYYFHQFPTHFLLSNLWVVPLVGVILSGGLLLLVLTPLPALQQGVAWVVNQLLLWQHSFLRWVEQLPAANLHPLSTDGVEILLFYLVIAAALYYLQRTVFRRCLCLLGLLLILAVYHQGRYALQHSPAGLAFYGVRHAPVVHCVARNGRSWVVSADTAFRRAALEASCQELWAARHLQSPQFISNACRWRALHFDGTFLSYGGRTVCFLTRRVQHDISPSSPPVSLDYLYVTPHYRGSLKPLVAHLRIGRVVIDATLSSYRTRRLIDECRALSLPYIDLHRHDEVFIPV